MKAKYQWGFGGIEEVLAGEVDESDSIDDLEIKAESKIIILPKIIGVYQYPIPDPESEKDHIDLLGDILFSSINIFRGNETTCPGLICIGYDPSVITTPLISNFLDGSSGKRIKIKEHYNLPDFNEKKISELYNSSFSLANEVFNGESVVIEKTFNVLSKLREEYGLTGREYLMYTCLQKLKGSEFRDKISRDLSGLKEHLNIDFRNP